MSDSQLAVTQNPESTGGWQAFLDDRVQRRDQSQDPALKAHFEAEIQQAQLTLEAIGQEPGQGGEGSTSPVTSRDSPVSGKPLEPQSVGVPGTPPIDSETDSGGTPGTPLVDSGAGSMSTTEIGPGLHPNLEPYREAILNAARETGVPADLLVAVIWDESKGEVNASTVNGGNGLADSGLMQVNSDTYGALKASNPDLLNGDPSSPEMNVMAGALYLKENYEKFGSWDLALRAYNSGPGSVVPSDPSQSTTGLGTKNYVDKVNYYWDIASNGGELPLSGYPGGNVMY